MQTYSVVGEVRGDSQDLSPLLCGPDPGVGQRDQRRFSEQSHVEHGFEGGLVETRKRLSCIRGFKLCSCQVTVNIKCRTMAFCQMACKTRLSFIDSQLENTWKILLICLVMVWLLTDR